MGNIVKGTEIATIDVVLVTVEGYESNPDEIVLDTSNKIDVTVATETEDKVALIVKGRLIAQKPPVTTVTGNTIVLTDNVFNDRLVKKLQGGTIEYDEFGNFKGYTPPVVGSKENLEPFKLNCYSAIYNAAGILTGYEKITYPNCQGTPIAFSSEDGTFRASEYTINSAPNNGEAPYHLEIVSDLPINLKPLTVVSAAGTESGTTAISVTPELTSGNSYRYVTNPTVSIPQFGDDCSEMTAWNGTDDIPSTENYEIVIVEVDNHVKAVKAGKTKVIVAE